jgi:hypothetical protein
LPRRRSLVVSTETPWVARKIGQGGSLGQALPIEKCLLIVERLYQM